MPTLENVIHLLSDPRALARAATASRSIRNRVYRNRTREVYHGRAHHTAARQYQRRIRALNTAYRLGMNYGPFIHLMQPYARARLAANMGLSETQLARLFMNIQRIYIHNQTPYNNLEFRRLVNQARRY